MNRFQNLLRALIALSLVAAVAWPAHACFTRPAELYPEHDEAIDLADWIFYGEVIEVRKNGAAPEAPSFHSGIELEARAPETYRYIYTFRIDECLKGACADHIEYGSDAAPLIPDWTYRDGSLGHEDSHFWVNDTGRILNHADCELHPQFFLGGRYLVFGPRLASLGFERIQHEDDAWLNYVRSYLEDKTSATPFFPKTLSDYALYADVFAIVSRNADASSVEVLYNAGEFDVSLLGDPLLFEGGLRPSDCAPAPHEQTQAGGSTTELWVIERFQRSKITEHYACYGSGNLGSKRYHVELLDHPRTFNRWALNTYRIEDDVIKFMPERGDRSLLIDLNGRPISQATLQELKELLEVRSTLQKVQKQ